MTSPESREPTVFAIAGQTATGKTRLGEGIMSRLHEQGYHACMLSVGDMFRLLTMHTAIQHDPKAMEEAVKQTLLLTEPLVNKETGRIHLHFKGESFKQTYDNGNSSASLTSNPAVIYHVNHFIETRITGIGTDHDFVGLDGRERRNAHILFRTFSDDPATRVAIRRMDQPADCCVRTDEEIYRDIAARDVHERPFVRSLLLDDVNVVHIDRKQGTPEADTMLVAYASTVLVSFREGKLPSNFGTLAVRI